MSIDCPKRALFRSLASLAQACAHEHRLELLELMAQGEQSVEALALRTGLSVANTSQHLQLLRRAGLADTRRNGRHVFYRLADDVGIVQLLEQLRAVAEGQLAEVQRLLDRHFHVLDAFEPVDADTLMGLLDQQAVTLIDVRPEDEYLNGHLLGARSVPHDAIEQHLDHLPRDRPIVAYCRGPYCVMAFNAVSQLRALGFDVQRFESGYPQWKAAGLPVEQGAPLQDAPRRPASGG